MTQDGAVLDDEVRVSDADRQAVVDRLSSACGDGLLSLDEFADHAGKAYAAITRAELDGVLRDLRLPVVAPMAAPPARPPDAAPVQTKRRWVVAVMGGEERRGRWRAGRRIGAVAIMGGVDLDLRDALLEDDVVEITAWAVMGGVTVIVPEGIPVESSGFMLMGGRSNRIKDVPTLPGAPIVRVRGFGMWGGIDVRSKPRRTPDAAEAPAAIPAAAVPPPEPESPPGFMPQAGLVTIVCTDLVGSTRMSDRLGDQQWRSLLAEHNAIVREQLARHSGHEVKTAGDGFLCTFTSSRRAVAFAVDLQDELAAWRASHGDTPLELRIGIHAGEVERDGGDIVGRNVALACRLCDAAAPGEVLVSAVVADLADSSSDLSFGDGRTLSLAGLDRPVVARPAARR
jgi:class 3 adenylate cyclase